MKTLIIEDEKTAIRNLRNLLSLNALYIEIVGELEGIEDTLEWFKENAMPDLIFMDIHLSDGSSFEIFDRITITCPVIFTTAYDAYALKAFKVNSIDYLLKPIQAQDINKALEKLKCLTNAGNDNTELPEKSIRQLIDTFKNREKYRTHFLIPSKSDRFTPLDISTVLYFYIIEGEVNAVTNDTEKIQMPYTLDEICTMVDPGQFFRVNRQYVIARKAVKNLNTWFTGRLVVNLIVPAEEKIIMSRQKVTDFKKWIEGNTD